jgi:hypothetical protein
MISREAVYSTPYVLANDIQQKNSESTISYKRKGNKWVDMTEAKKGWHQDILYLIEQTETYSSGRDSEGGCSVCTWSHIHWSLVLPEG